MILEYTLSIIKPNAISKHVIGDIIKRFENNELFVVGLKMMKLNFHQVLFIYNEHKDKLFFNDLLKFMISNPVVLLILEGYDAINRNRLIIGHTNPVYSAIGTIRKDYADSITENAIHGSASKEAANREIYYFFKQDEIYKNNISI
ncbi:MAG: nucleoside-diphosphate kinase [Candidatus Lightella neohaematopini]|nr:nucleoside-diphosphate kinase [Candidatus Lightella neohaematopini]MCV2528995.1 nucleoside-diphosphate kinase [Candidatus Lightella neohaematopini]